MSFGTYGDIAIVNSGVGALVAFPSTSDQDVSVTRVLLEAENEAGEVASWGVDNNYPKKFLDKVRKNESAMSGQRVIRKAHYGSGFILAEETFDKDGKREIIQKSIRQYPDIKEFWRVNKMKRFWLETILDLEYWAIAFPEYILSKDFKKINRVERKKTAHCRFELMNEKTGHIKNVYLSTKWGESPDMNSDFVAKIPLIDNYWTADEVKQYCKKNKIRNFVRPIFYPLLDESYYPKADWHSADKSGWLDIANSIPEFKKAFIQNQINIKFLIEVSELYFDKKYGDDWRTYTSEERKEIRDQFVTDLDETLRDNANAGKSILSVIYTGNNGEPLPGLKITTIDNKLQDGAYSADTGEGVQRILTAIGVDPSLIGAGIPGGKLGAGSGSDKREAWLILSALLKTNRETTLEVFEFIQEYNSWDENLIGGFEDTVLTTLDKNPKGTEKAAQL